MRLHWKNQREFRPIGIMLCVALLLSLYFVYLGSGNGFAANFGSNDRTVICNSPKTVGPERGGLAEPILIGNILQRQPVIPARFVAFDFKQNLRQWPVLSGDISRSPPLPYVL